MKKLKTKLKERLQELMRIYPEVHHIDLKKYVRRSNIFYLTQPSFPESLVITVVPRNDYEHDYENFYCEKIAKIVQQILEEDFYINRQKKNILGMIRNNIYRFPNPEPKPKLRYTQCTRM